MAKYEGMRTILTEERQTCKWMARNRPVDEKLTEEHWEWKQIERSRKDEDNVDRRALGMEIVYEEWI